MWQGSTEGLVIIQGWRAAILFHIYLQMLLICTWLAFTPLLLLQLCVSGIPQCTLATHVYFCFSHSFLLRNCTSYCASQQSSPHNQPQSNSLWPQLYNIVVPHVCAFSKGIHSREEGVPWTLAHQPYVGMWPKPRVVRYGMDCVIGLLLSHTALFPTGVCLKAWSLRYNGFIIPHCAVFRYVRTHIWG